MTGWKKARPSATSAWSTGRLAITQRQSIISIAPSPSPGKSMTCDLEGAALNNLSLVYDEKGEYKRSLEQYQKALALHRASNYREGESDALGNIGGVYLLLGHYGDANDYYQQALALDEDLDRKPAESQDLGNLAICQAAIGQLDESIKTFDRALMLANSTWSEKEEADWRKGRASTLLRLGKFDEALQEYRTALASYERAGLKRELAEALYDDGYVHLMLGDRRSAEHSFQRGIQVSKQISFSHGVLINTLALADVAWRSGDLAKAMASANEVVERARKLEDRVDTVSGLLVLSLSLRDEGNTKKALSRASEAVSVAQQSGAKLLEAQALDTQRGDPAEVGQERRIIAILIFRGGISLPTPETPHCLGTSIICRGRRLNPRSATMRQSKRTGDPSPRSRAFAHRFPKIASVLGFCRTRRRSTLPWSVFCYAWAGLARHSNTRSGCERAGISTSSTAQRCRVRIRILQSCRLAFAACSAPSRRKTRRLHLSNAAAHQARFQAS